MIGHHHLAIQPLITQMLNLPTNSLQNNHHKKRAIFALKTACFTLNTLSHLLHGSQVHWQMRCIGHQIAFGTEKRAGKVQALFDVDGNGRASQHITHLFGLTHWDQFGIRFWLLTMLINRCENTDS